MKKGTFLILIVLCLLAAAAGWFVKHKSDSTWKEHSTAIGDKVFGDLPVNDVAKLTIKTKNDTVVLARQDGKWVVVSAENYPADFVKISDFVRKLVELSPAQVVDVTPADLGKLELNAPDADTGTCTQVELNDAGGKTLAKLRFGKEHKKQSNDSMPWGGGWPDGRYLMLPDKNEVYLVSESFSNISDKKEDYLDSTFVKVATPKRVALTKKGTVEWELDRGTEGESLTLKGDVPEGKEPNTSKISSVGSAFSYARFEGVIPKSDETLEANGFNSDSVQVFELSTFDGFTYWISMGKKNDKGQLPVIVSLDYTKPAPPAPPEDEKEADKETREKEWKEKIETAQKKLKSEQELFGGWIYLLSSSASNNMLVERSALIKDKPKAEPAKAGAEKGPAGGAVPGGLQITPMPPAKP